MSREVVERGWVIEIGEGERAQQSQVFRDKHYFSIGVGTGLRIERGQRVPLTIRVVGGPDPTVPTGEWRFLLVGE